MLEGEPQPFVMAKSVFQVMRLFFVCLSACLSSVLLYGVYFSAVMAKYLVFDFGPSGLIKLVLT